MGQATLSGPVAVDKDRLEAATRNSTKEKGERKDAQKGSLWLCYTWPLAERQQRGISGNWQRQKPIPWERNSWGS